MTTTNDDPRLPCEITPMRLVDAGVPVQWRQSYRTRKGEPQVLELHLEVEAVPFQRELGRR